MDQVERIKAAFEDEHSQLETRVSMLQEELEEAQQRHLQEDNFRQQLDTKNRDMEARYKQQIEDLNRANANLMQEKDKV